MKRRDWFLIAVTVLNLAALGVGFYLHFWAAPVIVDGQPLKNCTVKVEPNKRIWTCGP